MVRTKKELSDIAATLSAEVAHNTTAIEKLRITFKAIDAHMKRQDARIERLTKRIAKLEAQDE